MALNNEIYHDADTIPAAIAGATAGDPVVLGQIPGVALITTDADGNTVLKRTGAYDFSVEAADANGTSAVAIGDILYYESGGTPVLNKKTTGVRFGYALEAITSGTATIQVAIGY